ncbi:MAG: DnaA regulatory inactivator Hda [Lysobacterales bacterium]|jgi:DnaA family protein
MLYSPQLPLQLVSPPAKRFDDFVSGPNGAAVAALRHATDEPGCSIFLYGPEGSGKTHLLTALCLYARERGQRAFYLDLRQLPDNAVESLHGLESLDLVCVDNLHAIAGNEPWEEALFGLFNRLRDTRGRLVVSSRQRLSSLGLVLPDLQSRLVWGLRLSLLPLSDEDLLRVIARRSEALGIHLPADVRRYLVKHQERNLPTLLSTVEDLHRAALAGKRRITIPLVREVLRSGPDRAGVGAREPQR